MNSVKRLCTYSFIARITNKLPTAGVCQLDTGCSICFCKQFTGMSTASLTQRELNSVFLKKLYSLE